MLRERWPWAVTFKPFRLPVVRTLISRYDWGFIVRASRQFQVIALALTFLYLLLPAGARAQDTKPTPVATPTSVPDSATKDPTTKTLAQTEKSLPVRIPRFDKPPVID